MINRRIVSPRFLERLAEAAMLLSRTGDTVIDAAPGPGDQTESLAPIHRALADHVQSAVVSGQRPVAIVGDCCQVIAVMAGLDRQGIRPALVWLDAHGDFNTWETTPSEFLGGMPLAMLTGRGDQRMMQAVALDPIADARVTLSDGRDLDPGERELVKASGISQVGLADVVTSLPGGPLYLHLDTDILDPREAPAFLYPAAGGPSADELRGVLAAIMATGRVVAISITAAWDATRDARRSTLEAVTRALGGLSV